MTHLLKAAPVVVTLREPRERLFGRLEDISDVGVTVRAIDVAAFDEWLACLARGEREIAAATLFFPLWRVERIALDERCGTLPAMFEQIYVRTGSTFDDALDAG